MIQFLQKRHFSALSTFASQSWNFMDVLSTSNSIYIDKTKHMANIMLDKEHLMFFHRPRRFGKSMILQGLQHAYNTRLQDTEIKGRSLHIISPTLFDDDANKKAIWSTFQKQLESQNYVAISLDFSDMKRHSSIGQFHEGLHRYFKNEVARCLDKYKPYFKSSLKSALEKSLTSIDIEAALASLTSVSDIRLVLLIDEYEAPLMECLKPELKNQYGKIETEYNSFFSSVKSAKARGLAKCVMTGVICLRNLSAFSDANSFQNLSLDETYREAFGFSIKEIQEHPEVQNLIDYLLSTRQIPPEIQKMNRNARRNHFINAMFEAYNGFRFTPKSVTENISLISPISMVNHMNELMKDENARPYKFDQYWAGTGQTSIIKSLAFNNEDPTESYHFLMGAKHQPLDMEILKKTHSIKEKQIPLNLLLFNTGYFTLKNICSNNTANLDWTNQETKEAFYDHYVADLRFTINELFHSLMVSKDKWNMINFVEKLHEYFKRMLEKHYPAQAKNDHEENHTFNLFLELLEYLPRSRNSKKESDTIIIYHQYHLTGEFSNDLREGRVPDFLFVFSSYDGKIKHIVFVEFWYLIIPFFY